MVMMMIIIMIMMIMMIMIGNIDIHRSVKNLDNMWALKFYVSI